jgi:predicted transcriptional regulator
MTTIQLKKNLIHQISEIEDVSFLNALKTIIDAKTQASVVELTEMQRAEIDQSKKNVDEGLFRDQSELNQMFEQWRSVN